MPNELTQIETKCRLFARKFFKHLQSKNLIVDELLIDYELVDDFMETNESKEMFGSIKSKEEILICKCGLCGN